MKMETAGISPETGRLLPKPSGRENREEQPWPGLASYLESEVQYFFGRNKEADELFRSVRRDVLTVLFGPSGTGKTSLIHAGLFTRLRKHRFLPVPIRLPFGKGVSLVNEVKSRVQEVVEEHHIEAEPLAEPSVPVMEETLWEYLHRVEFWDVHNQPITPVLVFDQFEEVFTLGHNLPETRIFLTELADLVENNIPDKVRQPMARDEDRLKFPYTTQHYRIVLALREDFVAHLDGLRHNMPAVMHSRFPLKHMNGEQAKEAVLGPGKGIVAPETAEKIVRFVGASVAREQTLSELEIEPALLNVVCRELNLRRLNKKSTAITASLLSGSQEAILEDFYERSISDLGPEVRIFIEDNLLTSSGFRDSMAVEDVYQKYAINAETISCLVDRRLLRMEERLRLQRVELIHDLLTGVVQQSRDKRKKQEEQAQQRRMAAELRQKLRRSRMIMLGFAVITIVAIYFMVLSIFSRNQVAKSADELLYNGLVRDAQISVSENPRLSLLLALEVCSKFRQERGRLAVSAEEAFREIMAKVSGVALTSEQTPVKFKGRDQTGVQAFSRNVQWLAVAKSNLCPCLEPPRCQPVSTSDPIDGAHGGYPCRMFSPQPEVGGNCRKRSHHSIVGS